MVWIRCDGNARIGAGHMMRCMTVVGELALLRGSGEEIRFVCADEDSGALAEENGFESHVLGTDYRNMESELPWWEERLGKQEYEAERQVILVDSYFVTDAYLAALGRRAYVVLMDDMGTHRYPADCVVNYNAPADQEAYRELYRGSETELLVGSRYVPLRRQFYSYESAVHGGQENLLPEAPVRDVLITAGGGDSENIAGRILERLYSKEYSFHVVSGRFHPCFRELEAMGRAHDNICIHHDVKDMAALMRRCQAAVTAGGSTVYELAALGVPFICFSYAENQEALTEYVGRRRIGGFAGAWHKNREGTCEAVGRLFEELAADPLLRRSYSAAGREMTDGRGARRLACEIAERLWGRSMEDKV